MGVDTEDIPEIVSVFRSGDNDFDTVSELHEPAGLYRAHFTVFSTGEVQQHYELTFKFIDPDQMSWCPDGYIYIGVTGTEGDPLLSEQWDGLVALIRWLFAVVVPIPAIRRNPTKLVKAMPCDA